MANELLPTLEPGLPVWVKPNAVDDNGHPSLEGGDAVAYVGRLDAYKGIDLVLGLARRLPNRQFLIVGRGDREEAVRAATQQAANIEWTPRMNPDEVLALMARARVLLVPSMWDEPFGRVAAEALSVGTPALVMDRGGLGEIVRGLPHELTVESSAEQLWSDKIERLFNISREETALLRQQCRARYEGAYTPSANAEALISIYRDALQRVG
ncbi:glycosyltransferase [Microbacterium schleiferi]|uniref:glycosyltransferase n=1 Tax=Microbacterium schleiferi TaxID=69362 RepID=UPI00311FC261